jgi:hypothetical protein
LSTCSAPAEDWRRSSFMLTDDARPLVADARPSASASPLNPRPRACEFECDSPPGILKCLELRCELSDRDGGWCHRQTRASPFTGALLAWTSLSTRSIKVSVKDSNGVLLSVAGERVLALQWNSVRRGSIVSRADAC